MRKFTTEDLDMFDPRKVLNTGQALGFDKYFETIKSLVDSSGLSVYPPYNVRKEDDNRYVIEMAVAGFTQNEIKIEMLGSDLVINGKMEATDDESEYIHKGIAQRAFTRKFAVADSVTVKNADLMNGMLKIWLETMIPESEKRTIPINADKEGSNELLQEDSAGD